MLFEIVLLTIAFYVFIYNYEQAKRGRLDRVQLDFRYRLFAIRDELREEAISGEIDKESWVFKYLDTTITKSINLLPRMSIWVITYRLLTQKKDPQFNEAIGELISELKKPDNHKIRMIDKKFDMVIGEFLIERHNILVFLSKNIILNLIKVIPKSKKIVIWLKKAWRDMIKKITESPSFSTLPQTCP